MCVSVCMGLCVFACVFVPVCPNNHVEVRGQLLIVDSLLSSCSNYYQACIQAPFLSEPSSWPLFPVLFHMFILNLINSLVCVCVLTLGVQKITSCGLPSPSGTYDPGIKLSKLDSKCVYPMRHLSFSRCLYFP